ncbi:MAG: GTP-sensing pleiotropic transcriptional regulator CodY [Clostridiales bacterium]|uniref:Global transcriptional regulator CodY n=1 Tax=Candidatus Pullilachnospira stercoravium TaxID=2840913 RepID=A0A9D1NVP3_9FIRM|nr:GTP-sensing pleiotropic transcriptional regulator CodY [Clostridiales bacterium]HIV13068.1 GTP-sensing pleiotropic transcriptional regulator CodY [Candidatus Pullilachnospira stercoravium]
MSVQLLDKTRKINKLLHNNSSTKVVFNDICKVMMETLDSNILVISKKGKVLGVSLCPGVEEITELIEDKVGSHVDPLLNDRFLSVLSTKENVNLQTLGFEGEQITRYRAIINPIDIAGERLGTVFMYRSGEQYDIEDIIVSEYGTTVVGLEMMRSVNEENAEEARKIQVVKSAFSTLSFSELEAIIHIFDELDGDEGILVASKIADRVGITRSVIVNALRKFESAGVIESRSSGMKGTYIKVLNEVIFDELEELKARKNLKSADKES